MRPPWFGVTAPTPADIPARPLSRIHPDDCHMSHHDCAIKRIERARRAAQAILDAPWATPSARRHAETMLAILAGQDVNPVVGL